MSKVVKSWLRSLRRALGQPDSFSDWLFGQSFREAR